ncbi:MAG: DNA-3-methyladenine glycosylase I [Alphaproteobacteria bacterium]|nr:DNA-3-methyladenine glycosylase I [Alphaproteobacteria bacterium]
MQDKELITGIDGKHRCFWCGDDNLYVHYHDTEWGKAVYDDVRLYEKICLEGFQAGLSWITILRKRENFRNAFDGFDFNKIAKYDDRDINRLLQNEGIIRHRGKIEATINNAQRAIELVQETSTLSDYFWSFKPSKHVQPRSKKDIVAVTETSKALSKDLKKRGWKFVGPTTCYAFMQAMGMVNDHIKGCDFSD